MHDLYDLFETNFVDSIDLLPYQHKVAFFLFLHA